MCTIDIIDYSRLFSASAVVKKLRSVRLLTVLGTIFEILQILTNSRHLALNLQSVSSNLKYSRLLNGHLKTVEVYFCLPAEIFSQPMPFLF